MIAAIAAPLALFLAQDVDAKILALLPKPAEVKWLSIPWQTNLMEARRLAAQRHQPLFLWIMNGHPMGCT